MGQIEIDELYIGVNKKGVQFVLPVQAKGHSDKLGVVQVWQDVGFCQQQFPSLVTRPIAVQFMTDKAVAMMELTVQDVAIKVAEERHYRLVSSADLSDEEIVRLRERA